jgi:lipopolysaccharide transport system ATP-binding protein
MSFEPVIRVRNLTKSFPIYARPIDRLKQFILPTFRRLVGLPPKQYHTSYTALRDINLDILPGETVGIIGRNGAGKSTLLQIICGTISPTSGEIEIKGRVAALLELGAGFNTEYTGRENVYMNARLLGLTDSEIESRFDAIVEFADIGEHLDQPVRTYSSGMFVRLAFATAIHVEPEILIVDEALAVGDANFQARCMKRINDIKNRGTSIIFVSHDINAIRFLCDRVVWLSKGSLIAVGDVLQITGTYMQDTHGELTPSEEAMPKGGNLTTHSKLRPVLHWGSSKGIVISVGIYSSDRQHTVFNYGERIHICTEIKLPKTINAADVSVVASIKSLRGIDLIVSTVDLAQFCQSQDTKQFRLKYSMVNLLTVGTYYLVIAVEQRTSSNVQYLEYIEGVHYFNTISQSSYFGVFHPEIQTSCETLNG